MKINILRVALFTPGPDGTWGLPLLAWGMPGVAKSAIWRGLARNYGMHIEVLSPACRGEGAFGVTPVPADGRMTYPRPDWTDKFEKAKRGIVFIDEINLAATHYAGALLGLLQDRVLGSYRLPPGVRIAAAANPIDIAAASGGWDLSAPAANRVGHLEWPCPDVKTWTDWLLAHDVSDDVIDAEDEEARVMAAWPAAFGKARGAIAGYISAHSSSLHAMPAAGSPDTSKAWPSPRTWEYAARALGAAIVYQMPEVERDEFVGCFVGEGAAGEFFEWFKRANLPNSADLLDGHITWKYSYDRLDIATAVFASTVGVCIGTTDAVSRKKRGEAMWALLAQAVDTAPDVVVNPAKQLARAAIFPRSMKAIAKMTSVLEAANITFTEEAAA